MYVKINNLIETNCIKNMLKLNNLIEIKCIKNK